MRLFKYKRFAQWAESEKIDDNLLIQAALEIEQGLYEVHLAGALYKKRLARKGQGKRGGYRTLIACKIGKRTIFMYGFAKSERDNITQKETEIYKRLANYYLSITESQIQTLIEKGELVEV